jgi:hypothetical protein
MQAQRLRFARGEADRVFEPLLLPLPATEGQRPTAVSFLILRTTEDARRATPLRTAGC